MRWNHPAPAVAAALLAGVVALGIVVRALHSPPTETSAPARVVRSFLDEHDIPGGVVAYGRVGEPIRAAAVGFEGPTRTTLLAPDARFPIASLSKPLVAATVLRLDSEHRLSLDDRLVDHLPVVATAADPRHGDITIRHLLHHTAGWDRTETFAPIARFDRAERELGLTDPPDCRPIAEAMLAERLQDDPGSHYSYSNLGYCWLEQVIVQVTGTPLADEVRTTAGPAIEPGWTTERRLTPTWARTRGELHRRDWTARELRVLGAAGGWTASAADVLAFVQRPVDPRALERPGLDGTEPHYYGLGWRVWPGPEGPRLTHFGAMPGVYALALRTADELAAVALFNARPEGDWDAFVSLIEALEPAVRADLTGSEVRR